MKVSYNWLKDYLSLDVPADELKDILTMLGLEVGKVETVGGVKGGLQGVVVGHVLSAEQHPNADRLRVCKVDVGENEPLNIVCGAPNVAAGQKVPVATVGTELYPFGEDDAKPFKIKKGKIRGEVSMGMICAEDELGIGTDHDGILVLDEAAKVGDAAIAYLNIEQDDVFEIELTPNRIDGASHYGVARDLAAHFRTKASLPKIDLDKSSLTEENPIPVSIEADDRCKRYTAIYIKGVTVSESPEWLKKRLHAIGQRPINNVVDVTNYVLHELGQPMHAFDADKIKGGKIIVKTMGTPSKFITLDEVERDLDPDKDLMICDTERGLCIAGTMGGINSGVTFDTKNVFLESAYFDAGSVRKTAKRHNINSDSSYRFERGTDPNMTETAALRGASLILQLAGGTASKVQDVQLTDFPHFDVSLSVAKAERLIGKAIGKDEIVDILQHLEMIVSDTPGDADLLQIKVPPYRVDVQRDIDVIEDILRVYGYNSVEIPAEMKQSLRFGSYQNRFQLRENYANYLSANGFYEIMNNSQVNVKFGDDKAVHILNPLGEELGIMRQSLLPGMLESIRYNQNRQNEDLSFYEFGKTYWKKEDFDEHEWLAIAVSGQKHPTHWDGKASTASISTLTKEVERMQAWFGFEGKVREMSEHPDWEYGLEMVWDGQIVLRYGKVSEDWTSQFSLRNEVYYMLIDWPVVEKAYFQSKITYQPIPQFPGTRRDISLLIDKHTSFAEIKAVVERANPKLIQSVDLHDIYQGKGIADDKKSYLVSIELRDDKKTLADKAADKIMQRAFQLLEKELQAEIRR
ncbi:MAG: phenylalanine--tRNA ligase subunit beta [Bacteroidota bacterium]